MALPSATMVWPMLISPAVAVWGYLFGCDFIYSDAGSSLGRVKKEVHRPMPWNVALCTLPVKKVAEMIIVQTHKKNTFWEQLLLHSLQIACQKYGGTGKIYAMTSPFPGAAMGTRDNFSAGTITSVISANFKNCKFSIAE